MKIGENGIISFTLLDFDESLVDKVIFTFTGIGSVEKEYPSDFVAFGDNRFLIGLTQEDTIILSNNRKVLVKVEGQINYKNGSVAKTDTIDFLLNDTLKTTIVSGNAPSNSVSDLDFHYENGMIVIGGSSGGLSEAQVRMIIQGYNYVTSSELSTQLTSYVTANGLNDAIATYITENIDTSNFVEQSDLEDYAKTEDLPDVSNFITSSDLSVYCPDDLGAVGDGTTIDDDAFLEGNYTYQLTEGKVYRVSLDKLKAIKDNACVGKGVIRYITDAYYNTHPYQPGNSSNTTVVPTYGDGTHIAEISARTNKNRLIECITNIDTTNNGETDMSRWYKQQAPSLEEGYAYTYRGIGAVYHDRDQADSLPATITLCIGTEKIVQRKKGDTKWYKTIDTLPDVNNAIRNYGYPWNAGSEAVRRFTNSPVVVGDHIEITILKEELTSWLGSSGSPTEGLVHFWTSNYEATTDEWYDLIVGMQVWVKEEAAAGKVGFAIGVDVFRDYNSTTKKYAYYTQAVIDTLHYLTTEPTMYYGCTMDIDGALATDFDKATTAMYGKLLYKKSLDTNYNILGFSDDFTVTQGAYTLAYDKDEDAFTFSIDENVTTSWTTLDLTSYLSDVPDLKKGDTYRFYIQVLSGTYYYQGGFYYASGKSIAISSGYQTNGGVYSKSNVADADATMFSFGTNATEVKFAKFRIWMTKGESYKGYQPYGEAVDCFIEDVGEINEITDEKIAELESKIDDIDTNINGVMNYDIMPTNDELCAMSNGTIFNTKGFYSVGDGNGGNYKISTSSIVGSRAITNTAGTTTVYLVYLDADTLNEIDLCKLGVRAFTGSLTSKTAASTYATANSDIIDAIVLATYSYGQTWRLPKGRFYFERTIDLSTSNKIRNLKGAEQPRNSGDIATSVTHRCGTMLFFPFLDSGDAAIISGQGNIEDVAIIGDPNNYSITFDRTKTISDPTNVITETIAEVDNSEYQAIGLNKKGSGYVKNVFIRNFYTGYITASVTNIYMQNVYAYMCHIGFSVLNDTKIIGIYGWNVHTLLKVRGSLVSATQVRVDSCVNAVQMVGTIRGCTLIDVDGDYCTESLIQIGDGSTSTNARQNTFIAIHGRCCALKSYDSVNGTKPSAADLTAATSSGYGVIHVATKAHCHDNYFEVSSMGGNPFDTASDYLLPKIVFTSENVTTVDLTHNHIILNDEDFADSEAYIKSIVMFGTTDKVSYRIDAAEMTYYINGDLIYRNYIDLPTSSEASTLIGNSSLVSELQTKIADTTETYSIKLKDAVSGDNYYVIIANGRFIGLTETQLQAILS